MTNIVLAGGAGTRFWPLSRRERPKQLVDLWGDQTMLEATVDRLRTASPEGPIVVVCGEHLLDQTRDVLDTTSDVQFLVEPAPRDTLPAIALAAVQVAEHDGDEPAAVFPADHYVPEVDDFAACLTTAERMAREGRIVTLGIEPSRPETGYGYIHFDPETSLSDEPGSISAHPVESFVEKPDREVAERYLRSGEYLWNAGMFCFEPSTLFAEIERQLPEMYDRLRDVRDAWHSDRREQVIATAFEEIRSISIDYGIMEDARDVAVVPAPFTWSDVGHWAALEDVRETDEDGNVVEAEAVLRETSNSILYSTDPDRTIAAVDIDDLVVVDTEDALLIVPRERAQRVRDLVDRLEELGRTDLL